MNGPFERVRSIISRLRNILRCQKCFELKGAYSMFFYRFCDHFYCSECLEDEGKCIICENQFDKPTSVASDNNILPLYQSVIKFQLPSKNEFDVIYSGCKQSKEEMSKNLRENDYVHNQSEAKTKNETIEKESSDSGTLQRNLRVKSSHTKENDSKITSEKNVSPSGTTLQVNVKKKGKESKVQAPSLTNLIGEEEIISPASKGKGSTNEINTPGTSKSENVNIPIRSRTLKKKTPANDKTPNMPGRTKTPHNETPKSCKDSNQNTLSSSKSTPKININKRNFKGETQLHLACAKKDFNLIKKLIVAGANPNAKDNAGWSPLHESVFSEDVDIIKFLLDNGAKVNLPGLDNTTALHEAIAKGSKNVVKLLLEYGASVNAMNVFRETPLDLVTKYNLTELRELLLNATPNDPKSVKSDCSETDVPLESIVMYNHDLAAKDEKLVDKFVEKFGVKIINSVTSKVFPTHIVVSGEEAEVTWPLLSCVPKGCWILTVNWITDSLKEDTPKPATSYALTGDEFSGFAKGRNNLKLQLPGLFCGCHFFLGGHFEVYNVKKVTVKKDELKQFIEANGGKILKRCPDPESLTLEKTIPYHADTTGSLKETSHYILYQTDKWNPNPKYAMSHMKTLPIDWLLACILKFKLIDPKSQTGAFL